MRPQTRNHIRHHRSDLFLNRDQAIALKNLVKECYSPDYIYKLPEETIQKKQRIIENGPSLSAIGSSTPNTDHRMRLTTKAFVSKKIKYSQYEELKKHINAVRIETNHIIDQVKTQNYRSINQVLLQINKSSKFNTFRSTADAETRSTIFKLPL